MKKAADKTILLSFEYFYNAGSVNLFWRILIRQTHKNNVPKGLISHFSVYQQFAARSVALSSTTLVLCYSSPGVSPATDQSGTGIYPDMSSVDQSHGGFEPEGKLTDRFHHIISFKSSMLIVGFPSFFMN